MYSKWLEVVVMNNITANTTESELRRIFATFGLLEQLVSDNGMTFMCTVFQEFIASNGNRYILTPVVHPATNGLAELYVGLFKHSLAKMKALLRKSIDKINRFPLTYRFTPHSTTGCSSSELLMRRQLHTRLSLLKALLPALEK